MSEIFDFGLENHKLQLNGHYFDGELFTVAADTAKRLHVQVLSADGEIINTDNLTLRLSASRENQVVTFEAERIPTQDGLYRVDMANQVLLNDGAWSFQWHLLDDQNKLINSRQFSGRVGANNLTQGAPATDYFLSFKQLNEKLEDVKETEQHVIAASTEAIETSEQAKLTANQAKSEAENVQEQLNTIVLNGDSSVEAAQARVASDTTYATLKERLDAEHASVVQQLGQVEEQLLKPKTIEQKYARVKQLLSTKIVPMAISLQGDSTGNEDVEWFYKTAVWLKEQYKSHTFIYRLWDHATQSYSLRNDVMQVGTSGKGFANLYGVSGYLTAPQRSRQVVTGDLDVTVELSLPKWTDNTLSALTLISKFGASGNRGWALGFNPHTSKLFLWWSADGTTLMGGSGSNAESTVGITADNNAKKYVRATLDVDNGSGGHTIRYYTSDDGIEWVQLGADITLSGTTSIFASTAPLMIGNRDGGTIFFVAKIYSATVKKGIGGEIVASPDLGRAFPSNVPSFMDAEGNAWSRLGNSDFGNGSPSITILNASQSGQVLAYSADNTRFVLQLPFAPDIAFVSYSHNETTKTAYKAEYKAFTDKIKTTYTKTLPILVAQNPQLPVSNPYVYPANQALRNEQIIELANEEGYALVDAFNAFENSGIKTVLISTDGVHPVESGSNLWSSVAVDVLKKYLI